MEIEEQDFKKTIKNIPKKREPSKRLKRGMELEN